MNIVLLAKKGGVGKSTLTILLYEALRQAGKNVAIRDWDAQGTSSKALELLDPNPAGDPDIVLYDTPPNLEHTATAVSVRAADIALVVTTPSPADLWEAEEAVRFVMQRNPDALVRLVYNKFRRTTILGRLVEEGSAPSAPALATKLSSRECYQHAVAQGWRALDATAREEVLQLCLAVLSATP